MDFDTASAIAKATPGSTLTRDEFGGFIVKDSTGRTIASSTQKDRQPSIGCSQCEEYRLRLSKLEDDLVWARLDAADLSKKLNEYEEKIAHLQRRISRVSEAEWKRIESEQQEVVRSEAREARERALSAAESGRASIESLRVILDQATSLGLSAEEYERVNEIYKHAVAERPPSVDPNNAYGVYANTDGQ